MTTAHVSRMPLGAAVAVRLRSERAPTVAVWAASAAYACVAAYLGIAQHQEFRSGFDLANFDQAFWLMARGEEPLITQYGRNYWGDHFGLTPALLAPLYLLGAGPQTLLVVQAAAMALVAPLLLLLARDYGAARWVAAVPALLWLASPLTLTALLFDFHHIPLVAPLIVGSVVALKRERYVLFGVLALLACGAKEDVPLMYAMLGVVVALEGRRRLGAAITAAALAIFAFVVLVFLPAFSDALEWFAQRFAGTRGDSLSDVVVWMLTHPLSAIGDTFAAPKLVAVALLVLTTGGLCLLAPAWMLLGAPALAHNLISAYGPQHGLSYHYHVPVALGFAIAGAVGVRRLGEQRVHRRALTAVAVGVAAIGISMSAGLAQKVWWSEDERLAFGGADARREALALIPGDAPVAASPRLTPHLSQRTYVYTLPVPFFGREAFGSDWTAAEMALEADRVEWAVVDTIDLFLELQEDPAILLGELAKRGFVEVDRFGSVHVLRRERS